MEIRVRYVKKSETTEVGKKPQIIVTGKLEIKKPQEIEEMATENTERYEIKR